MWRGGGFWEVCDELGAGDGGGVCFGAGEEGGGVLGVCGNQESGLFVSG